MNVLVACEFSGTVRDAFASLGHLAVSCDLLPSEKAGWHWQGPVEDIIDEGWDLMVAHPPCTHLAVSGARWFPLKQREQAEALSFVKMLLDAPIPRIALENPVSIIASRIRKPDQIIQPWMFGHEEQKTTCLWLKGLEPLQPTKIVGKGEFVIHGGRKLPKWYSNAPGASRGERGMNRSRTYQGIAEAMASQWGLDE